MPGSLSVSALDQKHPEWIEFHQFWEQIDLLYEGGWAIKQRASNFLWSRPAEPGQVYSARLSQFIYQNILGGAIGWYTSKLAEQPLSIHLTTAGGEEIADNPLAPFLANCDRAGTTLIQMPKQWFEAAVLYGVSYCLLDLPAAERNLNLRQQRLSGALDPYLINFTPQQVINWGDDRYGNLAWIVIRTEERQQELGGTPAITDRWYYFDTDRFRVYESVRADGQSLGTADERMAQLVAEGPHALAGTGRVPVRRISLPHGLRLGYRVFPQVLAHLNQDNAYQWALMMGCLPVAVITGDYLEPPKISETAYIKLSTGDTFSYTEPAGRSYKVAADRIASLREEIYRQMYLQAQGRSSSASASASSGYSKELDMAPSSDVLNEFGAILREATRQTIEDAAYASAMPPDLAIEIQGFAFEDRDELGEIVSVQAALDLNIPSDTFEKFALKRAALHFMEDASSSQLRDKVAQEIETAPTKSERAQMQQQAQAGTFGHSLETSLAKIAAREAA